MAREVYSRWNLPPVVQVDCSVEPSRTKQSFAEECDINNIMERYTMTGEWPADAVERRQAAFGDFSRGLDFMEAQNRLVEAQAAFDGLPARVRERFENEPAYLLDFLADPANRDEAVELGLVVKPAEPAVGPGTGPVMSSLPENVPGDISPAKGGTPTPVGEGRGAK